MIGLRSYQTEREVAELVAGGASNREGGRKALNH